MKNIRVARNSTAGLGLTQSSTSRHLAQLAATGILHVDSGEKTKRYSLNLPRYEETVQSLRGIADLTLCSGHG